MRRLFIISVAANHFSTHRCLSVTSSIPLPPPLRCPYCEAKLRLGDCGALLSHPAVSAESAVETPRLRTFSLKDK